MKLTPKRQQPCLRASDFRALGVVFTCVAGLSGQPALAQNPAPTILPPSVEQLLDAAPLPPVSLDPQHRYAVLVHEHQLLPLIRLAEPAIELAGRRINPRTAAAHAPLDYYGLTVLALASGDKTPIALPRGAIVGFPSWAPDGSHFAFTLMRPDGVTEMWIGEPEQARARRLVGPLHAAHGSACEWTADSRRLLCQRRIRTDAFRSDAQSELLDSLARQSSPGDPVVLSAGLTRYLLESQLELIDIVSGQRHAIGLPAAFESVSAAPAGAYLLVSRILQPYPRISGVDVAHVAYEIWDRFGNVVKRLPDDIRAVQWQAAKPATLSWVEQGDSGDRVMQLRPPYAGRAQAVFALPHRFSGLRWIGASGAALVSDYSAEQRLTQLWYVDFDAASAAPRMLTSYPSSQPRSPLMAVNRHGVNAIVEYDGSIYMRGQESVDGKNRAFLSKISLQTGEDTHVWQADRPGHEVIVDLLAPDASVLLTRHETASFPPNYFVSDAQGRHLWPLTEFEHPAPPLIDARNLRLQYTRDDGLELAASLYLPPGYEPGTRLPMVLWAYPRQVAAGGATRMAAEQPRFPTFERAFRLFFLLRGYAVLDGVSMPIVGDGSANDTFIKQIVANAKAAITAAADTGYVDPGRVGVAGHSYGAFMVANLLAHSGLFQAGAALSGAYNRTLTPFGFQTERRTLWEAPDTYLAMSPLLYSHRIATPLLLVHGLKDDNAGTSPLQSTQFYEAIRGNGGDVELLLLPWEGHSYRARESVLTTAAHMLGWFDQYLKADHLVMDTKETGAFLRPSP
jgi:dipeptidyl aminopeptidase/acylaminoacyl peptidase